MKAKMNNLRRLIVEIACEMFGEKNKILKEEAFTPESLPNNFFIFAKQTKSLGYDAIVISLKNESKVVGNLIFIKSPEHGACFDAYEVYISRTDVKGTGPLLYDIAIDMSSQLGGGLMSDRRSVSDRAKNIWNFIDKNRSDIIKKQLDNPQNELTPELIDNCDITVADKDGEDDWTKNSLSKVAYRSGMPIVRKLLKMGKIEIEDSLKSRLGL